LLQNLIYKEFFTQGDMEKTMGGSPVESMDRDKAYIPTLQIQFLDNIVIPLYGCVFACMLVL
jgi:cGMP-dependent 3',5'-cyclic phosphodiesterase